MRKGGREPALPPPIAMPAMINLWPKRLSFHLFLGLCSACTRRYRFFALHLFFEKNSVLQAVKLVLVVFFFGLHYISCGVVSYPNPKLVSNKISPPPQSRLLNRTVKTFFLVFTYVICGLGRPQSKILATPMINDESDISK